MFLSKLGFFTRDSAPPVFLTLFTINYRPVLASWYIYQWEMKCVSLCQGKEKGKKGAKCTVNSF